tara:strand:- start:2347 stop:3294 length:948 start_codon:yes stop_codon:yes gene_type:complete
MKSALLFLVFNRAKTTEEVFEEIRKARPSRLYVAADGPRPAVSGEEDKCQRVREIASSVDWPCKLETLFHNDNLGPRHAQESAFTWFFEREEEGVILEDDCLPDQSFFAFCDELLDRYRNEEKIFMISGNNFQNGIVRGDRDYYFSCYTHIWGWATWRRSWQKYDNKISAWPQMKKDRVLESLHSDNAVNYWRLLFDNIYSGRFDRGWDYRFLFSCWLNSALVVIPNVNLVRNIGFGDGATNCTDIDSKFSNVSVSSILIPIKHNDVLTRSVAADEKTSTEMFFHRNYFYRIHYYLFRPIILVKKIGFKVLRFLK